MNSVLLVCHSNLRIPLVRGCLIMRPQDLSFSNKKSLNGVRAIFHVRVTDLLKPTIAGVPEHPQQCPHLILSLPNGVASAQEISILILESVDRVWRNRALVALAPLANTPAAASVRRLAIALQDDAIGGTCATYRASLANRTSITLATLRTLNIEHPILRRQYDDLAASERHLTRGLTQKAALDWVLYLRFVSRNGIGLTQDGIASELRTSLRSVRRVCRRLRSYLGAGPRGIHPQEVIAMMRNCAVDHVQSASQPTSAFRIE